MKIRVKCYHCGNRQTFDTENIETKICRNCQDEILTMLKFDDPIYLRQHLIMIKRRLRDNMRTLERINEDVKTDEQETRVIVKLYEPKPPKATLSRRKS